MKTGRVRASSLFLWVPLGEFICVMWQQHRALPRAMAGTSQTWPGLGGPCASLLPWLHPLSHSAFPKQYIYSVCLGKICLSDFL